MCSCGRQAAIGAACFSHFTTSTCRDQRVSLWGIVVSFWAALPTALIVCFLHKLTDYSRFPMPYRKYRQLKSLESMLLSVDVRRYSKISKVWNSFLWRCRCSCFLHLPQACSRSEKVGWQVAVELFQERCACRTVTNSFGIVPLRLIVQKWCDVFEQSGAGNARPKLATKPHMLQCNY